MAVTRIRDASLRGALALERARLYAGLAAGLSDPAERTFAAARNLEPAELVVALRDLRVPVPPKLRAAASPAEAIPPRPEDLRVEYARLFAVPSPAVISPFESVHLEGRAMGDRALCVRRHYRDAGVRMSPGSSGPEDHIAVELEFMMFLALEEARAWRTRDAGTVSRVLASEIAFLGEHLRAWAPRLARAVEDAGPHPFYLRVARLLDAFVASDPGVEERALASVRARGG